MPKHNWTYKHLEEGCLVVCRECGTADKFYKEESQAKSRVLQLNSKVRNTPYDIPWGFNRRARVGKRTYQEAKRQAAKASITRLADVRKTS